MTSIASFSDTFVLFVCFVVHRLPRPSSAPGPWLLSVARPEATRSKCSRRTRCPSYKGEVHRERSPIGNVRTRFPRLPPSRRRRPGLQTAIATRCRIPLPAATDKMSVVQKRRITTSDAHSATSAPDFLVYRRAVGDGRASKPQSRRGVEFRLQRRRTRCPSYKRGGSPRATPTRQRLYPISSFTAEP